MPAINDQAGRVAQVTDAGELKTTGGAADVVRSDNLLAAIDTLSNIILNQRHTNAVSASPPYAKDAADRMRVLADAATMVYTSSLWGAMNVAPTYYSSGAPTSMDTREQQMIQSHIQFQTTRARWVIT